MRAAGQLVGSVLQHLTTLVEPGITTIEIDRAAEKMIRDAGALPTFKGYHGFPFSICASVNEQVVHGFPSDYKLKEGDIFSIDCGVTLQGFVGDTATTVPVGKVSDESLRLIQDHGANVSSARSNSVDPENIWETLVGLCRNWQRPAAIRWCAIMSGTVSAARCMRILRYRITASRATGRRSKRATYLPWNR